MGVMSLAAHAALEPLLTNALLGHYACEGLGQRVRKTAGGVTTKLVYDGNGDC